MAERNEGMFDVVIRKLSEVGKRNMFFLEHHTPEGGMSRGKVLALLEILIESELSERQRQITIGKLREIGDGCTFFNEAIQSLERGCVKNVEEAVGAY